MTDEPGRVLGLDPGQARIGVALSDPLGLTAQPLPTLQCVGPKKDLQRLAALAREHDVVTVVVGLPKLLSGAEGAAALRSRELAAALQRRLPGVSVELWDERLTTALAERTMIAGGADRKRRKQSVDQVAAVLILQSYLDARSG